MFCPSRLGGSMWCSPIAAARRVSQGLRRGLMTVAASAVAMAFLACQEDAESPTAPDTRSVPGTVPAFAISDGAHGGNPHFFFLPPLVAAPVTSGSFDPTLSPTIKICTLPSCTADLVTFTMGG